MNNDIIDQCLHYLHNEWMSLEEDIRPEGVWIRQYRELQMKENLAIQTWKENPIAIWFMSNAGILPRPIDDWLVFSEDKTFVKDLLKNRTFRTGHAAFAQCKGNADFYLEYTWGPRWGRGLRMRVNKDGRLDTVNTLWVS